MEKEPWPHCEATLKYLNTDTTTAGEYWLSQDLAPLIVCGDDQGAREAVGHTATIVH